MSDQFLALILTLGLLILMVAWVPFLDFLQHIVRRSRERSVAHSIDYNAPERPAQREM
jgi:hypothetical protein